MGLPTSEMPGPAAGAAPRVPSSPSANCQDWRLRSWTVTGSVERLDTETIMPTSMRQLMIVEPPYDTNGTGFPESGMSPSTPQTFTSSWMMMSEVQPAAMSLPHMSGA